MMEVIEILFIWGFTDLQCWINLDILKIIYTLKKLGKFSWATDGWLKNAQRCGTLAQISSKWINQICVKQDLLNC